MCVLHSCVRELSTVLPCQSIGLTGTTVTVYSLLPIPIIINDGSRHTARRHEQPQRFGTLITGHPRSFREREGEGKGEMERGERGERGRGSEGRERETRFLSLSLISLKTM